MRGARALARSALVAALTAALLAPGAAHAVAADPDDQPDGAVRISVTIAPLDDDCRGREVPASGEKPRPGRPDIPGCKGPRYPVCGVDPWLQGPDPLKCGPGPKDPKGPQGPKDPKPPAGHPGSAR